MIYLVYLVLWPLNAQILCWLFGGSQSTRDWKGSRIIRKGASTEFLMMVSVLLAMPLSYLEVAFLQRYF